MRSARPASLLLLLASALLAGACGGGGSAGQAGGSSGSAAQSRPGSAMRPAAARSQSAAEVAAARSSRRNVIATPTKPVKATDPRGMPDDEVNLSGANPVNPCSLVSRAQAKAILHGPVATPVSAPQGPTCIYTPRNGPSLVTLALEGRAFSRVQQRAQLRHRLRVHIAGHTAYCGVAGVPTMILPLPHGRLLVIAAPCPIAASFAATALPRIPRSGA